VKPLKLVVANAVPFSGRLDNVEDMDEGWGDDLGIWSSRSSSPLSAETSAPGSPQRSPSEPTTLSKRSTDSVPQASKSIFSNPSSESFARAVTEKRLTVAQIDEILTLRKDPEFDFREVEFKTAKALFDMIDKANDSEVKRPIISEPRTGLPTSLLSIGLENPHV